MSLRFAGASLKSLFILRAAFKIMYRSVNGPGIKVPVNLKAYLFIWKKKVSAHPDSSPEPVKHESSTLSTVPQDRSQDGSQNHDLNHAYGKESFGTWGARPCTLPGVTELQIHRPYVLSKGSWNDPSWPPLPSLDQRWPQRAVFSVCLRATSRELRASTVTTRPPVRPA